MDDDNFKHADECEEEIRELIDKSVGGDLMTAMIQENICPKCMALTLLEFAAYAATSAGSTAGEILAAASTGAMSAEDDIDLAVEAPPTQSRH
ncbi:MAG: hypothetical protein HOA08_16015 [Rhodospirillaceae bacterium]|nr:hypothetical protein [Rhodospirillaceae bacterium]MBT3492449.1 hypothetical protein [Rhodospirillaceae bacterium]MBT3782927.1 hypothetical protein [Rhodospirillaceae bacterium]MBT3977844.1 hypothetical protein [Rhodospirillaceae bacterium]MBT4171465.1 hypothetical protein [Rhodospirillaceae bacterium]